MAGSNPASAEYQRTFREFSDSLDFLKVNSKIHIDMLTQLAAESQSAAPAVVAAIEARLRQVPADRKLPILYLIDSIVKAKVIGTTYAGLFERNLAETFVETYTVVGGEDRRRLDRVLNLWEGYFPAPLVQFLRDRIVGLAQTADPRRQAAPRPDASANVRMASSHGGAAPGPQQQTSSVWPNYEAPPPQAHQNFYAGGMVAGGAQQWSNAGPAYASAPPTRPLSYDAQIFASWPQFERDGLRASLLAGLRDPMAVHQHAQLRRQLADLDEAEAHLRSLMQPQFNQPVQQSYYAPLPPDAQSQQPPPTLSQLQTAPPEGKLDVSSLLQQFMQSGALGALTGGALQSATPLSAPQVIPPPTGSSGHASSGASMALPHVALDSDAVKTFRNDVVESLYSWRPLLCTQCAFRFPADRRTAMAEHMDWHFRANKRERERDKNVRSRRWYLPVDDWLQYKETEEDDERQPAFFTDGTGRDGGQTSGATGGASAGESVDAAVAVLPDDATECSICGDKLERVYNQDDEEWRFVGAVRVGAQVFHTRCHADAVTNHGLPSTSPDTSFDAHPLDPRQKRKVSDQEPESGTDNGEAQHVEKRLRLVAEVEQAN
ncbi:hypothetical protein, variant 1 [Capsaspora owczarzaki ATCC 30864]|uniref:CID domain-containing protein n=2 Tax=Capsaspora owczarzaki (strain ATCC 30864) TaxID=595528 RepID=A0A0D2X0I5_CAPO3|nr:hypothetical protein, variant 1 [Capsaspora owczarzaki ATCC 30864]KJE89119.1 hypothetical protein, variant 1 [Capsaspora owczarzaki ATCC 30864]|eukprot:XP_011269948.1 hypothetical protein, variant 1 [Capsaspora owczarzaki ATCC 30864]